MQQTASAAKTKTEWKNQESKTEYILPPGQGDYIDGQFIHKSLTTSEKLEENITKYRNLQEKIQTLGNSDSLSSKESKNLEDYKA